MSLSGEIVQGDLEKFLNAAERIEPLAHGYRVILLDSLGGSVREAFGISEALKLYKYHAVIPDGALCASACGSIVFVGGALRTIEHLGALGQHSCSIGGTPSYRCNEVISQHAIRNGVSHGSIRAFVTFVEPNSILWFSREDVDGWGISLYPGSIESGFGKSEPRVIEILTGSKPAAQSAWRIDFRKDGFEAFLRPTSDDERELEINIYCDELQPGRLFLSTEINGPAKIIQNAIIGGLVDTDLFSWIEKNPVIEQIDSGVSEITLEIPSGRILDFLTRVNTLSIHYSVLEPYSPIVVKTNLAASRKNLIFAANNCVHETTAR